MAFTLGEYQDIFLEEADEQLQELNQNLLELEKNPDDIEIINNIFRAAHSLKSSAAFVGLNDLSDLAHKMENLLQGIRDKTLDITPEVVDIIFKCFDQINGVIETVSSGEEPKQDLTWLMDEIQAVSEKAKPDGSEKAKTGTTRGAMSGEDMIPKTVLASDDRKNIKRGLDSGNSCSEITVFIDETAQMKWVKAQLVLSNLGKIGKVVSTMPHAEDLTDDVMSGVFKVIYLTDNSIDDIKRACNIDLVTRIDIKSITISRKEDKLVIQFGQNETFLSGDDKKNEKQYDFKSSLSKGDDGDFSSDSEEEEEDPTELIINAELESKSSAKKPAEREDSDRKKITVLKTVKVSIDKLDLLLNNVGELVIANSGFYKLYEEVRKTVIEKSLINEFKSRMEQMSRIAKDLQTGIMKTRMVPIGQVFSRFNRLVRDLARDFNKKVELVTKGEETELDKKVIDSIGEPLLHLIRNAIDHGIEGSDERKRLGKSELATVTLNAYQGGNQIFVEVIDDGRGLNLEMIKKKALERNLATRDMINSMDNNDIYNFIFTPGFSTAEKITDISGRGVGMNVVKEIVGELNGNVSIETETGMGTRFVLSFPLTLAIIPAIMTKVRKETYAIPLSDVIETIKISESDVTTIEGHEVINLRGEILSLLRLCDFIGIKTALGKDQKIPVVVVGFGNRKIGLIVDYLEGKQEIVIKSLEQNYTTVKGFAGASILGDGSICLILDISSMINQVIIEQEKISRMDRQRIIEAGEAEVEKTADLIQEPTKPDKPADAPKSGGSSFTTDTGRVSIAEKLQPKAQEPAPIPETPVKMEEKKPEGDIDELEMFDDSPKPVTKLGDDGDVDKKVHEALENFKKELRDNIKATMDTGSPSEHMVASLSITKEDLNNFQVIANIGAANAAESLSKIINKRIDLTIPEVTVMPTEQIPKFIGDIDSIYMGVMLPMIGDAKGTLLFIINEDVGFQLIDLLYGTQTSKTKELTEDGESALQELTNILGSSVINVFAEKTGLKIKPDLPSIVHDYLQSVIDSILVLHNLVNDYAVVMDTAFFFENDQIIGNLLLLPEAESLKIIVDRMGSNGGSN
ncbi:MAG: chemotaxis protein CheW [Spirochaetes bacterium]|jgi:two-component system chemotaxis sensor kinase CheA|nr:chemotaxis protein CheW [Spirochaetota bacterium]